MDSFDMSGVTKLLEGISDPVEIAKLLDEYFEVSEYLGTVSIEDLRKSFYSSFLSLLYELLEDVCKFYQNRKRPNDTRNINYWFTLLQDLQSDMDNEHLSVEDAGTWLNCYHKQLHPHEVLLKTRNPTLFSNKTKISWFKTSNFDQSCAPTDPDYPSINRNIRMYLKEAEFTSPKFIEHIWAKMNNLYMICEVNVMLTDKHLTGILNATRNTIAETKSGKLGMANLKEDTMRKISEFRDLFTPEVRNKLQKLSQQAIRQNHSSIKEKLPGLEDTVPASMKGMWNKLPFSGNINLGSILQTITTVIDKVGEQEYGKEDNVNIMDFQALSGTYNGGAGAGTATQ